MVRHQTTIYDVARSAGVATSTVSRAFTQPSRINEKTVAKVLAAAEALGYSPNRTARGLSTGRTNNLAMVVPNIGNPFFAQFMRSFHSRAQDRGHSVYLIDTDENPDEEKLWIKRVASQVDGIALVSPRMSVDDLIEATDQGDFVVVNREIAGRACIWTDSAPALREAFADLVEFGHRRVVYMRGPVGGYSDAIRRRSSRTVAREVGVEINITGPQRDETSAAIEALDLLEEVGATAVVAHSDAAAITLISQCRKRGLDVPTDLSVLGHDDIQFASVLHPALTTISAQTEEIGRQAADALIDIVERDARGEAGSPPLQLSLSASYVRRESVAPAAR
ncbi:LacI family transcriptional regulator [Aeromicrobium sp. A1-2]|uniref:LacI family DNA-binding transcriptional regulator n=1 Tax=Aeromicrobium sp. A1-2 TaxID=2107713 RepID=UPI000E4E919D|nr:LacI family DNA-binding transcriptional regulator [Aeromicrobium sp. A1-2]AXT84253.1 LacI family transcriptional regulator [Aeromicrobium sp. A1-2]